MDSELPQLPKKPADSQASPPSLSESKSETELSENELKKGLELISDQDHQIKTSNNGQGRLYVTKTCLCFYSNVFGKVNKVIIVYPAIKSVLKRSSAGVIPNTIKVFTFTSFMKRDAAFELIQECWQACDELPDMTLETKSNSSPTTSILKPPLGPRPQSGVWRKRLFSVDRRTASPKLGRWSAFDTDSEPDLLQESSIAKESKQEFVTKESSVEPKEPRRLNSIGLGLLIGSLFVIIISIWLYPVQQHTLDLHETLIRTVQMQKQWHLKQLAVKEHEFESGFKLFETLDMCRELLDFVIGLFPRKKNILFPFVNSGVLQFMKDDLEWVGHDYKMYVHQGLITNSGIECLTHDDFSVGLIGTNPDFQRQGLAAKAVRHTLEKRFNMFQALGRDYFSIGFVAKDNHPSHKLMQSVGFKPIEGYQLRLLLEHLQKEQPYFFIGMLVGFLTGFRKDQILLASLNGDCVCGINQSTFVPSLQLKGSDVDQRVLDWMLDHFPDGPQLTFSGITPLQHSKLSSIISWNWAEGDYQTCVYRGTPPPVQERWTLGDDEYVLTRIQPDDVALIEQLQTVEYPDGYLHSLATKSPFCELGAVSDT
ncbi:hypothetical protein EDD86DRAFT_244139 [Gorgonomyces haynaldii]|nr:hypothetical protein EDD86DRAFT_244139 [Gorgonomyces haynaldii]